MEQLFNFNNELLGKIALVTGGTKGAGKAIADRLLQAGATVIITARNAPEKENNNLHFIPSDLSKAEDAEKVISKVLSTYGRLDILINNLGGSSTPAGGFASLSDDDWISTLQANLLAPVGLDRGFLPQMIERKSGVIIHIASIQGKLPLYDSTLPYASASWETILKNSNQLEMFTAISISKKLQYTQNQKEKGFWLMQELS